MSDASSRDRDAAGILASLTTLLFAILVGWQWALQPQLPPLAKALLFFLFWPALLLIGLVPFHNIGTEAEPLYEGTPIHVLAGLLGMLLGALFWAGVSYWSVSKLMPRRAVRRERPLD